MRKDMNFFGKGYMARGLENEQHIQVLIEFMRVRHQERSVAPFEDHGRAKERQGSQL